MFRLAVVAAMLLFGGTSVGQFLGSEVERSPTIASDLVILDASQVAESDRVAVLGDKAIVNKSTTAKYATALAFAASLLVVQDPASGKYGTSDGGIIVRFTEGENLADIASDHGLDIKHEFSALPMGVLMPSDINAAAFYLSSLRSDSRIVTADLDVNYYDAKPS